jgi:hypothetical protein
MTTDKRRSRFERDLAGSMRPSRSLFATTPVVVTAVAFVLMVGCVQTPSTHNVEYRVTSEGSCRWIMYSDVYEQTVTEDWCQLPWSYSFIGVHDQRAFVAAYVDLSHTVTVAIYLDGALWESQSGSVTASASGSVP